MYARGKAMLSHVNDDLSLWEIAHRWYDADPNSSEGNSTPLNVQDLMRLLSKLLYQHEIQLSNEQGNPQWNYSFKIDWYDFQIDLAVLPCGVVFQSFEVICIPDTVNTDHFYDDAYNVYEIDPTRIPLTNTDRSCCFTSYGEKCKKDAYKWHEEYADRRSEYHIEKTKDLDKCFRDRIFDKKLLDNIFIGEDEIARICMKNDWEFPEFWFGKPGSERYDEYKSFFDDSITIKQPFSVKLIVDANEFVTKPDLDKLKLFNIAALDAHNEYWKEYDKNNKSDEPEKKEIIKYLKGKYSPRLAIDDIERIQIIIRHPSTLKNKKQGRGA